MEWLNNISEDIIPNNITNKEEKCSGTILKESFIPMVFT